MTEIVNCRNGKTHYVLSTRFHTVETLCGRFTDTTPPTGRAKFAAAVQSSVDEPQLYVDCLSCIRAKAKEEPPAVLESPEVVSEPTEPNTFEKEMGILGKAATYSSLWADVTFTETPPGYEGETVRDTFLTIGKTTFNREVTPAQAADPGFHRDSYRLAAQIIDNTYTGRKRHGMKCAARQTMKRRLKELV